MHEPHHLQETLRRKRRFLISALGLVIVVFVVSLLGIYQWSIGPKDPQSTDIVRLVIKPGDTGSIIAEKLYRADLIKSKIAFRIYAQISNTKNNLQAGGYTLSRNLSVADIIDHMSTGKTDEFDVRIVPGLTLKQQYDKSLQGSFAQQGFSDKEITEAFKVNYDTPLLAQKPQGTSLEGYIYPDTYRITADSDLRAVLQKSFDEFWRVIQENAIEQQLQSKGLTLHQGLTLASIIQKEASNEADQKQISQVFFSRLASDMPLGSDVTFIYAAELMGVEPKINLDSPYNTRVNKGIPPGPIANFNLSALKAVVQPAEGDYLYFVADPDGKVYYGRTLAEHEANVERYNKQSKTDFSY